jgi:hypothetical protein
MNEISEGAEWRRYTKAQLAEQLARAIDDIVGFAGENEFASVAVMLDMARDLARAECIRGERTAIWKTGTPARCTKINSREPVRFRTEARQRTWETGVLVRS